MSKTLTTSKGGATLSEADKEKLEYYGVRGCVKLGLWCLTPLSTIFQLQNVYRGGQFYWWMKPEYRRNH